MKKKPFCLNTTSLINRAGVHPDLIRVSDGALGITVIEFGIPTFGGHRTFEQQRALFDKKRSIIDGRMQISPHQVGYALDFFAVVNGKPSWEPPHLTLVANALLQAANDIGVNLEWGGSFRRRFKDSIDDVRYGRECAHVQIKRSHYADLCTVPYYAENDTESGVPEL